MRNGARGREVGRWVGAHSKPFNLNRSEEVSLFGYKPSCFSSLRASCPWCSATGARKRRRACNYVSGV